VNAVGLTNPGFAWWVKECYPKIVKYGYDVIVSIMPETLFEVEAMAVGIGNLCPAVKGIEINVSCPNIQHTSNLERVCAITKAVRSRCSLPLILKLGYTDPCVPICQELEGLIEAVDVINTVPWNHVYTQESPLAKYGLSGGVSGLPIVHFARGVLSDLVKARVRVPIISGGGIYSLGEVLVREGMGANAFSLGTLFLKNPFMPNKIVAQYRQAKNSQLVSKRLR
jgi:dihydroorotate dehydrogenase